jgi:hypothetical protein
MTFEGFLVKSMFEVPCFVSARLAETNGTRSLNPFKSLKKSVKKFAGEKNFGLFGYYKSLDIFAKGNMMLYRASLVSIYP